jgi:hypothetical protein
MSRPTWLRTLGCANTSAFFIVGGLGQSQRHSKGDLAVQGCLAPLDWCLPRELGRALATELA